MSKIRLLLLWLMIIPLFLSACWDQHLLKDHILILAFGYDIDDEGMILKTSTFPKEGKADMQQQTPSGESEIVTTKGNTVRDTNYQIEQQLPEKYDGSMAKVIIIGEKLAEEGVFSYLDSLYRDLRGPLNASIAITHGTAREALQTKNTYSKIISDFYSELLKSSEVGGLIVNENVQSICPLILYEGKDIVLPYFRMKDDGNIMVSGLALFMGDKMTGKLNAKESTMFLVLSKKHPKNTSFNFKVGNDEEERNKEFVNFVIRKEKRKINMNVKEDDINVTIKLDLKIEVNEYSKNNLSKENVVKKLEGKIEEKLKELSLETINKLQTANSDALGIGERIRAFHNKEWKNMDWKEEYPQINIEPDINVTIVRHGIMN